MTSSLRAARLFRLVFFALMALTVLAACRGCGSKKHKAKKPQTTQRETEPPAEAPVPAATGSAAVVDVDAGDAGAVVDRGATKPAHFKHGALESHFRKHGAEMGFATKEEYLRAAQSLVRGGLGIEMHETARETYYYKSATNEFAVVSRGSVIRTYFKPKNGKEYWEKMKAR